MAIIEFALFLPFIAVLALGTADYGYYFYIGVNATEAARVAAIQVSTTAAGLNGGTGPAGCADPTIGTVTGATSAPAVAAQNYMGTAVQNPLGGTGVNTTIMAETSTTITCDDTTTPGTTYFGIQVEVDFPPASGKIRVGLPLSTKTSGYVVYKTPFLYRH